METEEIVLHAIKELENKRRSVDSILDIGSGSGCMGISASLALKSCKSLVLVEASKEALNALNKNVSRHVKSIDVELIAKKFEDVDLNKKFDLILSNPPYIALDDPDVQNSVYLHEPHISLFGGEEPTELIYKWVVKAFESLKEKGLMFFEFSHDQKEKLEVSLKEFRPKFFKDGFGKDRFFMIDKCEVNNG